MKSNYGVLFTAIALSVVATPIGALANMVITSRTYVDNQDATKQNKIPVAGTNAATPGDSVVMYTDTAGTIGERGIFDYTDSTHYSDHAVVTGHEDDLVPAAAYGNLENQLVSIQGDISDIETSISNVSGTIPDLSNLTQTTITTKTCVEWVDGASQTDANCLLWDLVNTTAYACIANGNSCTLDGECCSNVCTNGSCAAAAE